MGKMRKVAQVKKKVTQAKEDIQEIPGKLKELDYSFWKTARIVLGSGITSFGIALSLGFTWKIALILAIGCALTGGTIDIKSLLNNFNILKKGLGK